MAGRAAKSKDTVSSHFIKMILNFFFNLMSTSHLTPQPSTFQINANLRISWTVYCYLVFEFVLHLKLTSIYSNIFDSYSISPRTIRYLLFAIHGSIFVIHKISNMIPNPVPCKMQSTQRRGLMGHK